MWTLSENLNVLLLLLCSSCSCLSDSETWCHNVVHCQGKFFCCAIEFLLQRLLIVCVKSMSVVWRACLEHMFCVSRSLATGANFWVANLKSFIHVLAQAIVSCAQPEYYGLLATGHSMDGVTWIAVGAVALPFSSHRCFDKSFGLCIWAASILLFELRSFFGKLICSCVPPYVAVSRKPLKNYLLCWKA